MEPYILPLLVFLVAILYSSVGHGGASGYLAVLSLIGTTDPGQMATTALILNILVAGIAFLTFNKSGHFSFKLSWPFIIASIPAAFIGGTYSIRGSTYFLLLGIALILAAARMALFLKPSKEPETTGYAPVAAMLPIGAGIGFLSGVVGIGGGVFLSPIIILMRWAGAKQTAAVSAFFILVNSAAGLIGRSVTGGIEFGPLAPLLAAAIAGGFVGSHLGAGRISWVVLRRTLAVVLIAASVKLLQKAI